MPELNDNVFIDEEYYKIFNDVALDDSNFNNEELKQFINQASSIIINECHREFITGTATELFDGSGVSTYMVKQKRVNSITSIEYWNGSEWIAVAAPTYTFSFVQDSGKIFFQDGSQFFKGSTPLNWKIIYEYGWAIADIPSDLKEACCEVVKWLYSLRKKAGIASETLGDKTVTYTKKNMPDSAMSVINKYKRYIYA